MIPLPPIKLLKFKFVVVLSLKIPSPVPWLVAVSIFDVIWEGKETVYIFVLDFTTSTWFVVPWISSTAILSIYTDIWPDVGKEKGGIVDSGPVPTTLKPNAKASNSLLSLPTINETIWEPIDAIILNGYLLLRIYSIQFIKSNCNNSLLLMGNLPIYILESALFQYIWLVVVIVVFAVK